MPPNNATLCQQKLVLAERDDKTRIEPKTSFVPDGTANINCLNTFSKHKAQSGQNLCCLFIICCDALSPLGWLWHFLRFRGDFSRLISCDYVKDRRFAFRKGKVLPVIALIRRQYKVECKARLKRSAKCLTSRKFRSAFRFPIVLSSVI